MGVLKDIVSPPKLPPPSTTVIEPPTPRVTRMPTETDPDIIAAGKRTRRAALRRRGRQSTILTDRGRDTIGSSGQSLGR